jgi:hypothetical protein
MEYISAWSDFSKIKFMYLHPYTYTIRINSLCVICVILTCMSRHLSFTEIIFKNYVKVSGVNKCDMMKCVFAFGKNNYY